MGNINTECFKMTNHHDKLAKQQEMIDNVINWLKDEGYEPEEITHLDTKASYLAKVMVNEDKGFHVAFPTKNLDSVIILEMVAFNPEYQQAYRSLPPIEQNRFFFDLKIGLLSKGVIFNLEKGIRDLQSLEVKKVIYFDGLSKNSFFDTIFTVGHAIEIARVKLGQFRDSILPSKADETDTDNSLV